MTLLCVLTIVLLSTVSACSKTSKVGEYASPKSVWGAMQNGSVFCYNNLSDGTCSSVEYPMRIGKDDALITQLILSEDGKIKITSTQQVKLNSDAICFTFSKEYVESFLFYKAGSANASINSDDRSVTLDKQKAAIELMSRYSSQSNGKTTCFKYMITKMSSGGIDELEEHAFVDGIKQPRMHENKITFASLEVAKNSLFLRPIETK